MSQDIDYRNTEIPEDKPETAFSYAERRANILDRMHRVGHPRRIRQSNLAERYGVDQSTISRDLTALSTYVDNTLGDRRTFVSDLVFNRAIEGLLEDEEWRKAAQTVKDWNEWIDNHRELEEMDERLAAIEERQQRAKYR